MGREPTVTYYHAECLQLQQQPEHPFAAVMKNGFSLNLFNWRIAAALQCSVSFTIQQCESDIQVCYVFPLPSASPSRGGLSNSRNGWLLL